MDAWTGPDTAAYFAVIAHWMTASFQPQRAAIAFEKLADDHSATALATVVSNALLDMNLTQSIIAITGDNASVDLATTNILQAQGRVGEQCYVRCAAHVVNLVAQAALTYLRYEAPDSSDTDTDDDVASSV